MNRGYPEHFVKKFGDLRELVSSSAEIYGDKILYTYRKNKQDYTVSYQELYDNMVALGTALWTMGLGESCIAVSGDTHPSYMTAYLATVNTGGVIVPLDKDIKEDEIVGFLQKCKAKAFFYTYSLHAKVRSLFDRLPQVEWFVCIDYVPDGEENCEKFRTYDQILELGREQVSMGNRSFLDYSIDINKLCAIIFTSGTTGTSKGVMLSHKNLVTATLASDGMIDYNSDNTLVSVLPMHHTYEMTCDHLAIINIGASVFINDSIKYTMRNFAKVKPNALILVPLYIETMHKRIWDEIGKKGMTKKVRAAMKMSDGLRKIGIDLRRKLFSEILDVFGGEIRSMVCGGAAISKHILKDFDSFGITILEGYGITECAPLVAVNTFNWIKYGSVGRPVFQCEVKIDAAPGETSGEILVKGDNVMMGYYENPEATAEVFTEDGWFRTGDIGYMDEDHFIYITGRKKNIILLSNGKNIFPEELEEYLAQCDLIAESVVIGRRPEGKQDTIITAVIYPNYDKFQGNSEDEIRAAIKEKIDDINKTLPVFKHIADIEIRDTEFEKTTSRKIKRYRVK